MKTSILTPLTRTEFNRYQDYQRMNSVGSIDGCLQMRVRHLVCLAEKMNLEGDVMAAILSVEEEASYYPRYSCFSRRPRYISVEELKKQCTTTPK